MNRPVLYALTAGHWMVDLCQGIIPAMLPFLVERGSITSKAEAGRMVMAMSIASAVVQPSLGILADRRPAGWVLPVSVMLATIGVILGGTLENDWLVFAALALSGVGIAAFHPEGAKRAARAAGGKKSTGMSWFALGGTVGFSTAPLITTPLLKYVGLPGLWVVVLPGAAVAAGLWVYALGRGREVNGVAPGAATDTMGRERGAEGARGGVGAIADPRAGNGEAQGRNNWWGFAILATTMTIRAGCFYGLNTYLSLYFMQRFGGDFASASVPLILFLLASVPGTLLGGRLADGWSRTGTVVCGLVLAAACLVGILLCDDATLARLLCIGVGVGIFMPSSVLVIVGQELLPTRPGLASGVTLGLAVSLGGLCAPALGMLADRHGLGASLWTITAMSGLAAMSMLLVPRPGAAIARAKVT